MSKYLKHGDMQPAEIRYRINLSGWTQAAIARDLNCHPSMIFQIIEGLAQSDRVMRKIADVIGIPVERIRPSIYVYGGAKKPGRPYSYPPINNQ